MRVRAHIVCVCMCMCVCVNSLRVATLFDARNGKGGGSGGKLKYLQAGNKNFDPSFI